MTSGVQEALNEDNAVNTLMSRGLMVLSIQQKAVGTRAAANGKVSDTDLVLFTRQLATMVDAGLPLVSALTALYEQADPRKQAGLRRVVGEVSALVQQGESFLRGHPEASERLLAGSTSRWSRRVKAAVLLAEILDRLATFLESANAPEEEGEDRR